MADGATIVGVTGILTSGALGPIILHHAQKDRDTLGDYRDALDAAIEALSLAVAQTQTLGEAAFGGTTDRAEVDRRDQELTHQVLAVNAHGVKLRVRFGDCQLVRSYLDANRAVHEQQNVVWRRRNGAIALLEDFTRMMDEAEAQLKAGYHAFVDEAEKWHKQRHWPWEPFL